jgi:hypothetical protein
VRGCSYDVMHTTRCVHAADVLLSCYYRHSAHTSCYISKAESNALLLIVTVAQTCKQTAAMPLHGGEGASDTKLTSNVQCALAVAHTEGSLQLIAAPSQHAKTYSH